MSAASARYDPTWVDMRHGLVSRELFVDGDIYGAEVERLFNRSWLFLGHESEVRAPGDYVTRLMGGAPVILIRQTDGSVGALLNSCRHRGAELCRTDSGRLARFVCPYHGWVFERDGQLVTTTFDRHLPEGLDRKSLGLVPVTRVETYKGLVFGSWQADIMPLHEYLAEIGWYLDAFLSRTPLGMEVLAPPHRWRARANWKIGSLNFVGDAQHIGSTHRGPITLDPVRAARAGFTTAGEDSFQVVTNFGHGCTVTYLADGMPEDVYRTHSQELTPLYRTVLPPDQLKLLDRLRVIVGTIFPNLSFIETQVGPSQKALIMRLWQPLSATETEVLSWILAEVEAPASYKDAVLKNGFRNFGAAGVFEQDDLELWASATASSNNPISRRMPYSFHTALPYLEQPLSDFPWPGRAFKPADTEVAQLEFMRYWNEKMAAPSLGAAA